jgi:hypothetical protein
MKASPAFLDLGYSRPETPRQPRGASPSPVLHHRAPGDRSAGAAALREMRRQLDHAHGMLTDGGRPGDDPFARRQLEDAYERLKTALFLYNMHAADLGVPAAEAFVGGVPVTPPAPAVKATPAEAENRPAAPLAPKVGVPKSTKSVEPAYAPEIERARAAFFARSDRA